MAKRRYLHHPGLPPQRISRRRFLVQTVGAGLALGLTPVLSRGHGPKPAPVRHPRPGKHRKHTLFFDLSHPDLQGATHFLVTGGRWHELTKVSDKPQVLRHARRANAFLRAVPLRNITHHVTNLELSEDITQLSYVVSNADPTTGAWSMPMIVQHLPQSGLATAYARARAHTPAGALPLSAKRALYGHPPALTLRDLQEEQVLIDATDHARTLIGLHPDLLCAEPTGAQTIATNYLNPDFSTRSLAATLQGLGPATPQETPGQPNPSGWATLVPLTEDDGVTPFKNTQNLNQYFPDWHPDVDQKVATSVGAIHLQIKDDETLGADVTSVPPPSDAIPDLAGKVWYRRDGVTTVDASAPAAGEVDNTFVSKVRHGSIGLFLDKPTCTSRSDGRVLVKLPPIQNWFLRFLGLYVQFLDPNGNVIPVAALPSDTIPGETDVQKGLSKPNEVFLGVLPPAYTLAGIPIGPGFAAPSWVMPLDASGAFFFLGGAGFNGSWDDPDGLTEVGILMTGLVNWAVVALFMAVGVSTLDAGIKTIANVAAVVVAELVAALGATFSFRTKPTDKVLLAFFAKLLEGILKGVQGKALAQLITVIATYVSTAEITDSTPIVGQIARAVAAAIGGVQLVESFIEVGISPPLYTFELSLSHDLSVNILPDPNSTHFPEVPPGYTLYYKVTYLFDNGTPHVLDGVTVPDPTVTHIPVTLQGIPRGGKINISVGFYARFSTTTPPQNDWCAARGTTGLVDNTVDQAPNIVISEVKIPIQASTRYLHTRKTQLDAAGRHVWSSSAPAPAYVPPSGGQEPGDLGGFRGITVRQGTATQPGYLGYAWQAYSSGLNDCTANAPGQLDQAANLNTDLGNNGMNAQNGYATIPCALQGGAGVGLTLAYSLLTHGSANFYLDTRTLLVRQVSLDPPGFSNPNGGQAFCQLNLDSTALLLHPAGHLFSINNAFHKLEALPLPSAPLPDAQASTLLLARTLSGQGTRPGLITSPVAAAISADGVILVLEDASANNRIQAFDVGGNPVPFFKDQPTPYFLQLAATEGATYLDLAVEFTGYLYVLSQDPTTFAIRLDIYHPGQTGTQPICTTPNVNGAKLAVDFWRSVYTLNYEVLQLPGGGIPAITEPSVSLWLPSPPSLR
jgi:hypothetical protein